jgi:SAM-dependent methyltransferase
MTALAARAGADPTIALRREQRTRLALQCPSCGSYVGAIQYGAAMVLDAGFRCSSCSFLLSNDQGIWKSLTPERQRYYERFLMEYQTVRAAEGRGSENAAFYLALPYRDLTGRNDWQWAIRARTFRHLERTVLPAMAKTCEGSPYVLDLGAGNCWLSYRLARRECRPVAVDLLTNSADGLGAASHYLQELPALFPRFQAELDRLPFADEQFDCAMFNASFHYSENSTHTLGEAIRCLRPGGTIVIADSPFYRSEESGQRMLEEREKAFTKQFGFPSNSLSSLEYLTEKRLRDLEARFGISWHVIEPSYGLRWSMRPFIAKWKGNREPSQFRIYTATVKTQ